MVVSASALSSIGGAPVATGAGEHFRRYELGMRFKVVLRGWLAVVALGVVAFAGRLPAADTPATVPSTRQAGEALHEAVGEAKGLDEALTRLHAPMRDSKP